MLDTYPLQTSKSIQNHGLSSSTLLLSYKLAARILDLVLDKADVSMQPNVTYKASN